jgi:hypothetical protein
VSREIDAIREEMAATDSDLTRCIAKLALSLDHPNLTLVEVQRALWSAAVLGFKTGQAVECERILQSLRNKGAI